MQVRVAVAGFDRITTLLQIAGLRNKRRNANLPPKINYLVLTGIVIPVCRSRFFIERPFMKVFFLNMNTANMNEG